jgi:predicted esterase
MSEIMQAWPRRNYAFTLPVRYFLSRPVGPGLVICAHGFQDHALSMLRRIGWWQTDLPFQILALNGPFPVPFWTGGGFKEAYSWYFRDTDAEIMLVDPATTSQTLSQLITELSLENSPKIIFGFSQGGFMAPYLAAKLKNVKGVIGLGCGYKLDAYSKCSPLEVHAIHGMNDERVSIEKSRTEFSNILKVGHRGSFHEIPSLGHKVDAEVEPLVRNICLQILTEVTGKARP